MRLNTLIALGGIALAASPALADIDEFTSAVLSWNDDEMSGTAQMIESSIDGNAFIVCYQQTTGTNWVFAVNNSATGVLEDVAALSAMEIFGVAYSSTMGRLAISFRDLQGNPNTILFGTDGLPMRTFPGTSMVAFDNAGSYLAVAGQSSPVVEVALLSSGESVRAFVCPAPILAPNAISIASENGGQNGVVGAVGDMGSMVVWELGNGSVIFSQFDIDDGDMISMAIAPGCTYVGGGGEAGEDTFSSANGYLDVYALPGSTEITGQRVYRGQLDQLAARKIQFTSDEEQLLVGGLIGNDLAVTAIDWREGTEATVQISVDEELNSSINDFALAPDQMVWATASDSGVTAFVPGTASDCVADLDGNDIVDGGDLAILLANWQGSGAENDLDGNGIVDGGDLSILLALWGSCQD